MRAVTVRRLRKNAQKLWPLGIGMCATAVLILFVLMPTKSGFLEQYARLTIWDGGFYMGIAEHGYGPMNGGPTSIGFFPGYPLFVRLIQKITTLPIKFSGLIAAALACSGLCAYIIVLLRRWGANSVLIAVALGLILSYPTAFFLVSGYSESLFFCMLLGMLYWQEEKSEGGKVMSIVHGFILGATRITGPLLSLAIFLRPYPKRKPGMAFTERFASVLLMSTGCAAFFGYCAVRYGNWLAYLAAQKQGWGVRPDYLTMFNWKAYQIHLLWPHLPSFEETGLLTIPVTALWFLILIALEFTVARKAHRGGWRHRLPLYYCAFIIFFISISAVVSVQLRSIGRYMLGSHILLVLATIHLIIGLKLKPARMQTVCICFVLLSILFLRLQATMAEVFLRGGWVAIEQIAERIV